MKQPFGVLCACTIGVLFVGCDGGQGYGPITLKGMPYKNLSVTANNNGGAGVTLNYDAASKCGTLSSAQATVNGVALNWVDHGGHGVWDPDNSEYKCVYPSFSLPQGTSVPPNADGRDLLVVRDSSESWSMESTDWFAPVSATLRPIQGTLHRGDELAVDLAPQRAEFQPRFLTFSFVDPGAVYALARLEGWTARVNIPVTGSTHLVASWQRTPTVSACNGPVSCNIWSYVEVNLGQLQIE